MSILYGAVFRELPEEKPHCQFTSTFLLQMGQKFETKPSAQESAPIVSGRAGGTKAEASKHVTTGGTLSVMLRKGYEDSKTNSATSIPTNQISAKHGNEYSVGQTSATGKGNCKEVVLSAAFFDPPNVFGPLSSLLKASDGRRMVSATQTRWQLLWAYLPQAIRTLIRRLICRPDPVREMHSLDSVPVTCSIPIEHVGGHDTKSKDSLVFEKSP